MIIRILNSLSFFLLLMSSPLTRVTFDQIWHHLNTVLQVEEKIFPTKTRSEWSLFVLLPISPLVSQLVSCSRPTSKKYQTVLQDHYLPDGCPVFKNVHFSQHIYNIRTWIQSKKITTQNICRNSFVLRFN